MKIIYYILYITFGALIATSLLLHRQNISLKDINAKMKLDNQINEFMLRQTINKITTENELYKQSSQKQKDILSHNYNLKDKNCIDSDYLKMINEK